MAIFRRVRLIPFRNMHNCPITFIYLFNAPAHHAFATRDWLIGNNVPVFGQVSRYEPHWEPIERALKYGGIGCEDGSETNSKHLIRIDEHWNTKYQYKQWCITFVHDCRCRIKGWKYREDTPKLWKTQKKSEKKKGICVDYGDILERRL